MSYKMCKLFLLLVLTSVVNPVLANESTNQNIDVTDTKAIISVQKKPGNTEAKQKATIKNVWFSIIIQCDGKVPFDQGEDNNTTK